MKIVFLTGAHGFIGKHLKKALLQNKTYGVTRISRDYPKLGFEDVKNHHAIVHLATNYGRNKESLSQLIKDNTIFPLQLLEQAIELEIPLFVNLDTAFTIDYPYQQAYTISKKHFVKCGEVACKGTKTRFINLKLHYIYGPGDNPLKFIPSIINKCLDGDIVNSTPGEQRKDFTYVDDVVSGIMCILESFAQTGSSFVNLDCGTGKAVAVRECIEMIHRYTFSKSKLKFGALPYRDNEEMLDQADNTLLSFEGWAPKVALEDGLQWTIADIRNARGLTRGAD